MSKWAFIHTATSVRTFLRLMKTLYIPNKNSQNGRAEDRRKVAGGQNYEVNYEKDKLDTS